jgi:sugar phosphate isomerase/epimerase
MPHAGWTRRGLLASAGVLGGSLALARLAPAQEPPKKPQQKPAEPAPAPAAPKKPLFELSLAEGSLHRALQEKRIEHLDFPVVARKDYDIGSVELVNTFFKDKAKDITYLHELLKRAQDNGVRCGLIRVDDEGPLAHPDDDLRDKAVARHRMWLNAAAFLGCHSLRVNLDGEGSARKQRDAACLALDALGNYAEALELRVLVENKSGYSTNPAWLAEVLRQTAHKRVGTLPDFGSFKDADGADFDRYKGVEQLMPWACAVSARSWDFDERGEERTIDFQRMLKIVVGAGYHSWIGIEYDGQRLSEPDGIRATKKLLLKVRDELAAQAK